LNEIAKKITYMISSYFFESGGVSACGRHQAFRSYAHKRSIPAFQPERLRRCSNPSPVVKAFAIAVINICWKYCVKYNFKMDNFKKSITLK